MRLVVFWAIMLCLLWAARSALADDYSFHMGPGIAGSTTGSVKTFSLRKESDILYGIRDAYEGGFWVDNRGGGNASSGFGKVQIGVSPGPDIGAYAKAFLGVGAITQSDTNLGGNFQFFEDVALGVRDETTFVELGYSHVSSAGLSKPNRGRDFYVFGVGVRF